MPAKRLDGKALAQTMRAEVAARVAARAAAGRRPPGLAAVLVGDNPASKVYVRNKRKACEQAGLESWLHELPAQATQAQLLDLVNRLNRDAGSRSAPEIASLRDYFDQNIAILERAGLVTKQRVGRRKVVRTNIDRLRIVRRLLDQYEELWRGRIDRMAELISETRESQQ